MTTTTGTRFGRLTTIKVIGFKFVGTKRQKIKIWECKCDCGNTKNTNERNLKDGTTKSCGCMRYERQNFDLTGKVFGRLKVEKQDVPKLRADGRHRRKWICKCDCGNTISTITKLLTSGKTNSCGKCHYSIKVANKFFGSYIEASMYLRLLESGVEFEHDKPYLNAKTNIRYDFYIPSLNHYIEVSSFDKTFNGWHQYVKKINDKKLFVENVLHASFEFINRKHNSDDIYIISKFKGKFILRGKEYKKIKLQQAKPAKIKKITFKRLPMVRGNNRTPWNQVRLSFSDEEYKRLLRISKEYSSHTNYVFKDDKYMVKYFIWSYMNHLIKGSNVAIMFNLAEFYDEDKDVKYDNVVSVLLNSSEKVTLDKFMSSLYPDVRPGLFFKGMFRYHFMKW